MKKWLIPVGILIAGPALADTYTWQHDAAHNAAWSNSTSWSGGVAPGAAAGHDIVLTNSTASTKNSWIYENWTINSLAFAGGPTAHHYVYASGASRLNIGAGGISGAWGAAGERWLITYAPITFTAAEVSVRTNFNAAAFSINFGGGCVIDSSVPGGTAVKLLTGYSGGYTRFDNGSSSTTNVSWILENSHVAIYNANPTAAFGSNTLKVAWSSGGTNDNRMTKIGFYGNQNAFAVKDVSYFDTPVEVDAAAVGTSGSAGRRALTLISQRGRNDSGAVTNYIRGKWTSKDGTPLENGAGTGWLQVDGISDAIGGMYFGRQVTVWAMDASGLQGKPIGGGASWNGDVSINNGFHVVGAPHAFGSNNTWEVNLTGVGAGSTILARQLLLADGITYNGRIRSYASGNYNNIARNQAWLGIHGTGTGTYAGTIVMMNGWLATDWQQDLVLYAGAGGTARFTGTIMTNTWASTNGNPNVYVTGGGTVWMEGTLNYAGKTLVQSNTTFKFDGLNNSSEIEILAGSTLMGEGSTAQNVILGGDFAPGASIGTFYAGADVDFLGGSTLTIELGPGDTCDLLSVTGDLDISGATLRLVGGDIGTFTIASYGTLTGSSFFSIDTTGLTGGVSFDSIDYTTNSQITLTVIPEPASILLMAGGLVAAWKLRRRA